MIRKITLTILFVVLGAIVGLADSTSPVKWTTSVKMTDETNGVMMFTATIDDGWHLYSTNLPKDGPVPLSVKWGTLNGVKLVGEIIPSRSPHEDIDMVFHLKLSWWTNNVTLIQNFIVTDQSGYSIDGFIRYMVCNNVTCQSPVNESFAFTTKGAVPIVNNDTTKEIVKDTPTKVVENYTVDQLWTPVNVDKIKNEAHEVANAEYSFWYIFLYGLIGGFIALLTPCVWPMIPLTVSLFLKKHNSRVRSVSDAFIYGVSIVVIYLILGLIITMVFGVSILNAMTTNPLFNIIFFILLLLFAISFFGAFDISLPDSWADRADNHAERSTGILSIFFMAFTLTLVSFSCTGPIIGTLLVEAASIGSFTGPAVGMLGFSLALAIPFTIFAVFPSWMKEIPKSGGWLNSVKIVLGFIELALSLKFLSVADLAYGWNFLDREVFLSIWIVIFILMGLYLLKIIKFTHEDDETKGVGVPQFFLALAALSFSVYLIPGLWGAPLKGVGAFVPPLYTQDFNLYGGGHEEYDNYDEGMNKAAGIGKPILVSFSAFGNVNGRKMEASLMGNNAVRQILDNKFTAIKLMVDDKKILSKPMYVKEDGKELKLETYGDRWAYLQRYKFGSTSQPYYVVLDTNGNLISGPHYYDEDIGKFEKFLETGIKNFNK